MAKYYFLFLLMSFGLTAQIINFPDANFKAKLLTSTVAYNSDGFFFDIDANSDGEIEVNEALQVIYLNVSNSSISDLTGVEMFTNLQDLNCRYNQLTTLNVSSLINLEYLECSLNLQLTTLNVNGLTSLKELTCYGCRLSSLDASSLTTLNKLNCASNLLSNLNVNGLINLEELYCNQNLLSNLNVNNLTSLKSLYCDQNQLSSLVIIGSTNLLYLTCKQNLLSNLNVNGLTNLKELYCDQNLLSNLNVNNLTSLKSLYCNQNQLSSLNLNGLIDLNILNCNQNQLSSLEVSNLTNLMALNCSDNQLITLNIKNGSNESESIGFNNNPSLQYICADGSQILDIQNKITQYGYTNCQVNSYCSFTPGGTFYTIQGNNKFDSDNNGTCDFSDLNLLNLNFNITDGTNTGSVVSNTSGDYSIPIQAGTHTLTPVLENPTYFTASPPSVNISFPAQTSPFTQDFCVTANGVHPDLEVSLLPIIRARPGFDATYKIIYKNKGNTTQSGTVNLAFNDAILDFVTANPVATSQTVNNLSWDFVNLLPFETREIGLTLNVNSPTDNPAVNNGDILNYTATITSAATDEMPSDNTFTLNQTVVNSYDPNDKTCLEGATIPPSKVGDYVHYMIRFENTGTFPAENIVVKDMIDLAKFDITSLVPMKGSHSFVTNITSGNKVEFIFENINLPFDDANNDGYVAFKIKTKPTLVLGNTFSNTASIYFDYNFPIVTNTATTTIAALSRQDFEFNNYFSLYPNPVSDVLNITSNESIKISSINIYNTLGQLVLVIPNAEEIKAVDVSNLSSGHYFIKINSDKGTSNTKFIKQ